jgi:hypothetical protein
VGEGDAGGVEDMAGERGIKWGAQTVRAVADNGVAQGGELAADLVGYAGEDGDFEQAAGLSSGAR